MSSIEITLKSGLNSKYPPREGREPTIFARTIRHLIDKSKPGKVVHPGKIVPVYVEIDGNYKVLGSFTFNTGGSISFFTDIYDFQPFDHITLEKDFINRGGHLTVVSSNGKHKKTAVFDAAYLSSGDYHLATFGMVDGDLLMDDFPIVKFPLLEMEKSDVDKYLQVLEEALHHDQIGIKFPEGAAGIYCIQILISPKDRKEEDVRIYTDLITKFMSEIEGLDKPINAAKVNIIIGEDADFMIYMLAFRLKGTLNGKLFLTFNKRQDAPAIK